MPNKPVPAAPEGLPDSPTAIAYKEAASGLLRRDLIRVSDHLCEAADFCEAVFMAANGIDNRDETAVFQRLAEVAKSKIREAMSMIDGIRGVPEDEQ